MVAVMVRRQTRKTSPKKGKRAEIYLRAMEIVKEWGRQGGRTRAQKLSSERRQEIAMRASATRWAKAKKKPK
jgi:hypothetical protein